MEKHFDAPGSSAWNTRRAGCFNAGDAPAMAACSPNLTRSQLLEEIYTGLPRVFSDFVQERVIDPGHRIEAVCRPIAEEILDEELAILAGTLAIDGISKPLGASLDGLTFMEDVVWECKTANEDLRAALPHHGRDSHERNDGKQLPKAYRVQMEQQLLVTGAEKALFSAARIDEDDEVSEERHCWYYPDPELRAEIIAGWRQFDADLAAYVPVEILPAPVAKPVTALPSVSVQVSGQIAIRDNFAAFEVALRDFIDHRLIREPANDQDFADLDLQIKALKNAEQALDAAESQMLAQVDTVDTAKRTKDMLHKLTRDSRLMAEKLLEARKQQIRVEILQGGNAALAEHMAALTKRLGKPYLPAIAADFAGAMKNKRTVASLRDAVDTVLTSAKIEANQVADRIQINLATLRDKAADHVFLFPDTPQIVLKATDDLSTLVTARIAEHKEKEQKRLDAERERIRQEEAAKLQLQQEEAERQRVAEEQARSADAVVAAAPPSVVASAPAPAVAPAPSVIAMPLRAAAPTSKPTLSLGQLKERIAPIQLTADGLATLGFVGLKDRGSVLFHEAEYPHILAALVAHVHGIQAKQAA